MKEIGVSHPVQHRPAPSATLSDPEHALSQTHGTGEAQPAVRIEKQEDFLAAGKFRQATDGAGRAAAQLPKPDGLRSLGALDPAKDLESIGRHRKTGGGFPSRLGLEAPAPEDAVCGADHFEKIDAIDARGSKPGKPKQENGG